MELAFNNLIKKASDFFGINSSNSSVTPPVDGEIVYCKNNVCVHPPASLSPEIEHYPGYLNIRSQEDEILGYTLILTWIPNTNLKRNPRSIENSPAHPKLSPRRSPRQEYACTDWSPSHLKDESEASSLSSECDIKNKYKQSHISKDIKCVNQHNNVIKKCDDIIECVSSSGNLQESQNSSQCILTDPFTQENEGSKENLETFCERNLSCVNKTTQKNMLCNNCTSIIAKDSPLTLQTSSLTHSKDTPICIRNSKTKGSSSNPSVTSLEMEGDKLFIVTELQDSPFIDEHYIFGEEQDKSEETFETTKCIYENVVDINRTEQEKLNIQSLKNSLDLKLNIDLNDSGNTPNIEIDDNCYCKSDDGSSTTTSGPDTCPPSPLTPVLNSSGSSPIYLNTLRSENGQGIHNLMFPENSVNYSAHQNFGTVQSRTAKEQMCGVFSVDLGQMRFLRIFYSNDNCNSGHLVIASRESQYKILHFHHGGLDRLSNTFSDWKFLAKTKHKKQKQLPKPFKQFMVVRPYMPHKDKHPDEGAYEPVNQDTWHMHMSDTGQIEDQFYMKKATFFAGIEPSARQEVWPFLLSYYPYSSTLEERDQIRNDRYIEYQNIRKQRESMTESERTEFWRNVECVVEKDAVRTDRSHPYFKGTDNPNIEVLKNILLNYAVAQPHCGYTQGMSDLLAPILAVVQNEVDAYWCFVGLMQKTIFVSSPRDVDMDNQLNLLRELLKLMVPRFYSHIVEVQDGIELLFCHRWILLCFKREFPEYDALRIWEACWAHYQTDYFHLFVSIAIISVYGEDVVEQNMPADETLLHFSSLAMHINANVILQKARALLHKFRTRRSIPCTLQSLCSLCGSGMWDSGYVPTVKCVGKHLQCPNNQCPYGGVVDSFTEDIET